MEAILLEVLELCGEAEGEVGGEDFEVPLAVEKDVVGVDVAQHVLLPIRVHLRGHSGNNEEEVPKLFLCEVGGCLLPRSDLGLESGGVLVVKLYHQRAGIAAS